MHRDHPALVPPYPDTLQAYRLRELKNWGANAYRSSHSPMTPEMLDACDGIGFLVIRKKTA